MVKAIPPIEILLIEDNPADVRLTQEALGDAKTPTKLHVVQDGIRALEYLRSADAPRPDLVLLDLNLPRKDGREVLDEIKRDDTLRHIPVIVLTTSQAEQDILRSYQLRANAYITKPVDLEQFFNAVRSIDGFWLSNVKFARP